MPDVPDEDQFAPRVRVLQCLAVDLGDQWASGVDDAQSPATAFFDHGVGDPVGRVHRDRASRHILEPLHKDGSPRGQVVEHVLVVDDLVQDVDR